MAAPPLRLGVSACLLGREVRWDGTHRRHAFVAEELGARFELVPVCPEVDLGMGVPREPIRLVGTASAPRLLGERSGEDHTAAMEAFAARRAAEIDALGVCGFVAKSGSPSCGLRGVPVHPAHGGDPRRDGAGIFARALVRRMPLLAVEEEAGLAVPALRDAFVERALACARRRGGTGGDAP